MIIIHQKSKEQLNHLRNVLDFVLLDQIECIPKTFI